MSQLQLIDIDWSIGASTASIVVSHNADDDSPYAVVECQFNSTLEYVEADYHEHWLVSDEYYELTIDNFEYQIAEQDGDVSINRDELMQCIYDEFDNNYQKIIKNLLTYWE